MLPNRVLASVLEWRAGHIQDPVARLRFLRRSTHLRPRLPAVWRRVVLQGLAILALVLFIPVETPVDARGTRLAHPGPAPEILAGAGERFVEVWQVEASREHELYSNGLRIERGFEVSGEERSYQVYGEDGRPAASGRDPVGIAYHTSESHLAAFEPSGNRMLRLAGFYLLEFVRRNGAYHYVIDRFGRVHRVVREAGVAQHAGASVWSDGGRLFVGLNRSFLGVAFEGQTRAEDGRPSINPAQVRAARLLTELLRWRYKIAARNCVTHAMISVNPRNFRIGYHTDWAGDFPFLELGLTDNYARPLPSMFAFGFNYDPAFVGATGFRLWQAAALGEERLRQDAYIRGVTPADYRKELQTRFTKIQQSLPAGSVAGEDSP